MNASFLRTLLFLAASAVLLVAGSFASPEPQDDEKHIKVSAKTVEGAAGEVVWVTVQAKTDKHWHTYSSKVFENSYGLGPTPTEVSIVKADFGKLSGKIKNPKGHKKYDEGFEMEIELLEGSFAWKVPIKLNDDLEVGKTYKGTMEFYVQMCDTTSCLQPGGFEFPFSVAVIAAAEKDTDGSDGASRDTGEDANEDDADGSEDDADENEYEDDEVSGADTSSSPPPGDAQGDIALEMREGLLSFFLYGMGIGFLALLTPCVFPMIPITVSFFTKRNEKERSKAMRDAFIFAFGIVSTFTLVGLVVSAIFGATSVPDLAANPWLNLGIGVLFIALAFNLFGAFEIQVPTGIMNKLNAKSQGTGVLSVLMMGLVFSLTSFTCTVPFVGTLFATAAGGSYLYPAVGTMGFATAFAIPFFFLALFPSLLVALPKAGGWMNNLKVVMGFLEIAAAIKFFSTAEFVWGLGVLPREPFLAIWAGVCFLIVLYLLGTFEMKLDSKLDRVSGLRAFFAVIFVSLGFYFVGGMMGKPIAADLEALLPPDNYHELIQLSNGMAPAARQSGHISDEEAISKAMGLNHDDWYTNLDEAKAEAKRTGKPIFIDFTGFACTNCRLMEKNMFPRKSVTSRFKDMILVQLFTDRKEEPYISNQQTMREFGTVANPLYVVLKSDGSYAGQHAFTRDEQAFVDFLDQGFDP